MMFWLRPAVVLVFTALLIAAPIASPWRAPALADQRTFTDSEGHTVDETTQELSYEGLHGEWVEVNEQWRVFKDPKTGKEIKKTHLRVVTRYKTKGGKQLETHMYANTTLPALDNPSHHDETWEESYTDNTTGITYIDKGWAHTDDFGEPFDGDRTITTHESGKPDKTTHYEWCDDCEEWEPYVPLPRLRYNFSDINFEPLKPTAGQGTGTDQGVYLPPVAGPNSIVVGTVIDSNDAGPKNYMLAVVDGSGNKNFFKSVTDIGSHVSFDLPAVAKTISLFRFFDERGNPDAGASCDIGVPAHLSGTDPLPHLPSGPGITEAGSAYDANYGQGLVTLHTRGTDPLDTHALLDGSARNIRTLGVSNESYLGQIKMGTSLGAHTLTLTSDGKKLNSFRFDLVSLTADPIPPSHPGAIDTVVVHVMGLPPTDKAVMDFGVSGPAQLASGGETTTVPVVDNTARVQIRGLAEGQALVRFHLRVTIPGYWF